RGSDMLIAGDTGNSGHHRFICRRAIIKAIASINSFNCCRLSVPWGVAVVVLFLFTAVSFNKGDQSARTVKILEQSTAADACRKVPTSPYLAFRKVARGVRRARPLNFRRPSPGGSLQDPLAT